ncbi:MAG: hypothetical protein QOJ16_2490 [Acidobacteriota bacterium]|jgi:hypothetical protein|nr:hypothetical protein [Acidobacteriota bacterium]
MTRRLNQAFAEAAQLPEPEQDALADWLLAELESERRWDEAFSKSTDALDRLAEEALAEHRAGRTQDLDPENL